MDGGRAAAGRGGGEAASLVVRHHPILLLSRAWLPGLLMLLAAVAIVALATAPWRIDPLAYALVLWAAALVFLAGAAWAGREYLRWGGSLLLLTEHRLIVFSGIPHISETRRELRFERIETVELDLGSPIMRWCGCADLVLAVAGGPPLRFVYAREPVAARDHLAARLRDRQEVRAADDAAAIRASVERVVLADDTPPLPEGERARAARSSRPAALGRRGQPLLYFGRRIEGEVWQRHPWFLLLGWCGPIVLLVGSCAIPFAFDWVGLGASRGPTGLLTLVGATLALLWLAWEWGNWRNDYYVVTPERLIAIDQLPLGLRQQIGETPLDKVQDIGYRIPHPWALLLDYGDVIINTASDSPAFVLRGIARPRQLADRIDQQVASRELAGQQAQHAAMRAEFARWLTAYDEVLSGDEVLSAED